MTDYDDHRSRKTHSLTFIRRSVINKHTDSEKRIHRVARVTSGTTFPALLLNCQIGCVLQSCHFVILFLINTDRFS